MPTTGNLDAAVAGVFSLAGTSAGTGALSWERAWPSAELLVSSLPADLEERFSGRLRELGGPLFPPRVGLDLRLDAAARGAFPCLEAAGVVRTER
jgi:hypothetical protein